MRVVFVCVVEIFDFRKCQHLTQTFYSDLLVFLKKNARNMLGILLIRQKLIPKPVFFFCRLARFVCIVSKLSEDEVQTRSCEVTLANVKIT